jgi:hypothetical protein
MAARTVQQAVQATRTIWCKHCDSYRQMVTTMECKLQQFFLYSFILGERSSILLFLFSKTLYQKFIKGILIVDPTQWP